MIKSLNDKYIKTSNTLATKHKKNIKFIHLIIYNKFKYKISWLYFYKMYICCS